MASIKNKILAISLCFPPLVNPRSINVSRSIKALSELPWFIDVISGMLPPKERLAHIYDSTLLAGNQKFKVHVIPYGKQDISLIQILKNWLKPAPSITWENAAYNAALKILQQNKNDALITFAQPFSDHLIGLELKYNNPNLPWIAHFSDPWADNPYHTTTDEIRIKERKVIENADALIFTTNRTVDLTMSKYPEAWKSKAFVIPHGYDDHSLDISRATSIASFLQADSDCLQILHTGNLYSLRSPYALLDALAELKSEGMNNIHIQLIGGGVGTEYAFQNRILELDIQNNITCLPVQSLDFCKEAAKKAHVLMCCDAPIDSSPFLPSKLVDYLTLRLPILALTPNNGSTNDFIKEVGGISAPPDDVMAIVVALKTLLAHKQAGTLHTLIPKADKMNRYSIIETTKLLSEVLSNTISKYNS